MEFIETPIKPIKSKKGNTKMSENNKPIISKKGKMPVKEPKSIKLSTIWKALVYTFAVIGVILSVMYVNDIVNDIVDSRAEAKVQELLKAQPAAQAAPATELKANQ